MHRKLHNWFQKHTNVRYFLIAILVVLCAFEIQAILGDYRSTYMGSEMYLSMHHGQIVHQNINVPEDIQSWMTFAYINFVFKLPTSYLQGTLHISDPRYPNVQIRRYARDTNLDELQLTISVQHVVSAYGH